VIQMAVYHYHMKLFTKIH